MATATLDDTAESLNIEVSAGTVYLSGMNPDCEACGITLKHQAISVCVDFTPEELDGTRTKDIHFCEDCWNDVWDAQN